MKNSSDGLDVACFLKAIAKDTPENQNLIEQLLSDLVEATDEP